MTVGRRTASLCLVGLLVAISGCRKHSATQASTPPFDASVPLATPPAVPTENLGTAHPMLLEQVAPDGHWVAFCQARQDTDGDGKIEVGTEMHGEMYGDVLHPYFAMGGGMGELLDAFAGADPTGRYVVLGRAGKLVLLDTFEAKEAELAGGIVDDGASPFASRASISFDSNGRRLVYLRGSGRRPEVVVREIASGVERVIPYGSGELVRARLDEGGEIVWLDVVVADTNGSGTLELPQPRTTLASRRCRGRAAVYGTYGWYGDRPIRRAAQSVDDWQATDAVDAYGAFGQRIILRQNEAIVWRAGNEEGTLVPAHCKARILHADVKRERLYFVCQATATKNADGSSSGPIEEVDARGERHELNISLNFHESLRDDWNFGNLMYDHEAHKALNTVTGTIGPSLFSGPVALAGDRGLYSEPDDKAVYRPTIFDMSTGERRQFPYVLDSSPRNYAAQGDLAAIAVGRKDDPASSVVFDVARIAAIGTFEGSPLALAKSGYVLVAVGVGKPTSRGGIFTGPVHWIRPTPISH